MTFEKIHLEETDSTNHWLKEHDDGRDLVAWTDYQTAGRGSGTNTWESERGQNLLFSMLIHPVSLKPTEQFRISMAISLAIVHALQPLTSLTIKWPNDIYWNDRKLCGILIENSLTGHYIRQSIIGVGLNVNQTVFLSDAPNPVSLRQITGKDHDCEELLDSIINSFTLDINPFDYRSLLYRQEGFHPYRDRQGDFEARLKTVEDDGHLLLQDRQERLRRYAFKEVEFRILGKPSEEVKGVGIAEYKV